MREEIDDILIKKELAETLICILFKKSNIRDRIKALNINNTSNMNLRFANFLESI